MSSMAGYTIHMANEGIDPSEWGTASSTKAHYRRVKKFSSATPPVQNYERCGYSTGYTADADGLFSFGFIGAPENGNFKDFYGVCNICMAEDHSEEFVVQFLRKEPRSYVNVGVTFVKGLSVNHDGSVVFDGGKHGRDYADGVPYKRVVEDERFEIGMKVDFTWGFDYQRLEPKVVKCKGLCIDMPGFQMEIVGNFDASKNQNWDDKSMDFFKQTFNFRLDEGSEECYIRFARNHEEANKLGDYTIVTRNFQQRLDGVVGSHGIDLDFTVRHRSKMPESQASTDLAPQQEPVSRSWMEAPVEGGFYPPHQASPEPSSPSSEQASPGCDPWQQEPQEKEIRFFDHMEHKLLLARAKNFYKDSCDDLSCNACSESISVAKWLYRCPNAACHYAVHAACAQFPQMIRHPSHPEHIVKLHKLSPGNCKLCDACTGYIVRGLHYHCAMCDFDAHPVCPKERDCDSPQQLSTEAAAKGQECDPPQQYMAYQTQILQQQMQAMQLEPILRQSQALEQQRQSQARQLAAQQQQRQLQARQLAALEQQRQLQASQLAAQQQQRQLQARQLAAQQQQRQLQAMQLAAQQQERQRQATLQRWEQEVALRTATNLCEMQKEHMKSLKRLVG